MLTFVPANPAPAAPDSPAARRDALRLRLEAAGLHDLAALDRRMERGGDGERPARRRGLLTVALVLLTVAVLLVAGGTYLLQRYTASVREEPLLGAAAAGAPHADWSATDPATRAAAATGRTATGPGRGTNVLLVGIDERAGSPTASVRSDTIMIAHITARRDHVYLVSIPRDSRVDIPAYPRAGYGGGVDKVNAAYQFGSRAGGRAGGVELLGLTLRALTGIGFDAAAIVNFEGLRAAIDAVGGVDMCVDEETTSIHVGWDIATGRPGVPYTLTAPNYDKPQPVPGMRAQVYRVGCQHFVGWQALDYVRQRELLPDGDYGRQRHQQQLIKALAGKVTASNLLANPVAADRTLRALGGSVTFDGNGKSLTDWVLAFRHLNADAVTVIKTNGGRFASRNIGGRSFEIVGDTTRQLFTAMHNDTVGDFLTGHPDWVGR
jgi:polyisoprenyl-teichoic acid--peptidoglycan teichoic acid transferase